MKRTILALALSCLGTASWAAPTFVNGVVLPGGAGDPFGTTVNNGRLGYFSDLYFDVNRNEWWALSDRGPGGGTLSYETRVQRFTLNVDPNTGFISNFNVAQTIKFQRNAAAFNGLAPSTSAVLGNSFDPEGIVINPRTGNMLISDEYGPALYEFDRAGNFLRAFETPANLIPRNSASGATNFANDTGNDAGKRSNRGLEGLAISPNGSYSYAMLQSAMLDEGGGSGTYNRIVKFDNATGKAVAQYAYQMEGSSQGRGISALVAINEHEFLVLERNNRGLGVDSNLASPNKKVFRIDLAGATNLMGANPGDSADDITITGGVLPAGVNPVQKAAAPFLDLAADTLAELDNLVPEKWEGLSVGPKLADGSYLMLAGTDNDYSVSQNGSSTQFDIYFKDNQRILCDIGTFDNCQSIAAGGGAPTGPFLDSTDGFRLIPGVLHAYKVSAQELGAYVAPTAVSAPATGALLLSAFALGGARLRRKMARPLVEQRAAMIAS